MKEYNICNMLIQEQAAIVGDYTIKRVPEYDERKEGMYKPAKLRKTITLMPRLEEKEWEESCQYGSHQVTGIAFVINEEKDSVLFENSKAICDILFLYNFFTGGSACLQKDIDRFSHRAKTGTNFLKYLEEKNINVTSLILDSLNEINKNEWKSDKRDREILAFHFLSDAREPKSLNLHFIEEWICLAILCPAILGDDIENKKGNKIFDEYVKEIDKTKKNNFKLYLQAMRNNYVHYGRCSLDLFKDRIGNFSNPSADKTCLNSIQTEGDFDGFKVDTWYVLDYSLSIIFSNIFNIEHKTGIIDKEAFKEVEGYFNKYFDKTIT